MEKFNLSKQYKSYFSAKPEPTVVDIEPAQYLSISGKGDPSGPEFAADVQALYSTAYALKFHYKALGQDFVVSKLEGLWSYDENRYPDKTMDTASVEVPRSEWLYRLLLRQPDYVDSALLPELQQHIIEKKQIERAAAVEWHQMTEGKCVQMLHVGPFDTELETLKIMLAFMEAAGYQRNGLHHEIYLSDFRKTAPEKLKTILREPVR